MLQIAPNPEYLPGLPKYLSFVDEAGHSKDPRQNNLCLAGLITTESSWRTLDVSWRQICERAGLTEPFHMMDFAARKKQFQGWPEEKRRELLRQLISAIFHARAIPVGSVVSLKWFNALSEPAKLGFKDPHFLAFQGLTYHLAVAAFMDWDSGPVTMIYAHHPEHSVGLGNTAELWDAVRRHNRMVAMFMESYQCANSADHSGLQAADMWAYELRHHFEVIRPVARQPRWPFLQFVRLGLNYQFTHDFISHYDEQGLTGIGRMSRAQRLGEVDLLKPGFKGVHPAKARQLDIALRKSAAKISGKPNFGERSLDLDKT
ncbi:MAG TPA: DUF3800 domain-containing protein [Candidatus Acidoferrales bacterium]|nr:DUF3800 domain-containing protein [Candidatus Acidoferrales bacterium]